MFEGALDLIKAKLGITSSVRDVYIKHIIKGIVSELTVTKGIALNENIDSHMMLVVDYAEWRYSSKENPVMPKYIQKSIHDLMISGGSSV